MSIVQPTMAPLAIPAGMEDYAHAYAGVWAIMPEHAQILKQIAQHTDLRSHLSAASFRRQSIRSAVDAAVEPEEEGGGAAEAAPYQLTGDGIAIIEIRGVMMKFVPSLARGASTVMARRAVRLAKSDSRVRGILIIIDSPGGTVAGLAELADEIAAANKLKPVWVYAEDLMASAAQWAGSQGSRIAAGRTAMVGSCGTIFSQWDMSKMFAEAGVEVIIYESGDQNLKGAGAEGTKITPAQRKYFQSLIDETNTHFVNAVEIARPQVNIRKVFGEAAVYLAAEGKELGLIDEVSSFDAYYASFVDFLNASADSSRITPEDQRAKLAAAVDDAGGISASVESTPAGAGEGVAMSTPNTAGANPGAAGGAQPAKGDLIEAKLGSFAATASQIRTACAGATGDFVLAQVEQGATLEDAMRAHIKGQGETIAAHLKTIGERDASITTLNAEIGELKGKIEKGRESSVIAPGSQAPAGAAAGDSGGAKQTPEEQAKAEWAANANNCQGRFSKEKYYTAYRTAEIAGLVKVGGRRRSA